MNPDRWHRIKTLFGDAKTRDPSQRIVFLAEACGDDRELFEEVKSLLEADQSAGVVDELQEALARALNPQRHDSIGAGRKVSHYTLREEVGRGGMGIVYEAYDERLDRKIALKFLPPELSDHPEIKARFLKEARAASALDHPNICTIFDIGEAEGLIFLAMAFYSGQTLAARLESSRPDVEECLDIVLQIAAGLEKAHQAGIVHRDVKPSNIMLTHDSEVKVLDFGIAKYTGSSDTTRPGMRIGTIAYMSPEQIRGEPMDPRTDIWSLGVVLYEMLTGRHPFRSLHDAATMAAILESQPPPVSHTRNDIPSGLDAIVQSMLEKEPADRYASLSEVRRDISDLTAGSTLKALQDQARKIKLKMELPVLLTSFIGRDYELDQIEQLLEKARMVTLTGPGGTGKTRLGIEVASRAARHFKGEVAFVSLASIRDPGLVASAIMQALGILEDKTRTHLEYLIAILKERTLLLVLDNFEQVVSAAHSVATLLTSCPGVKVLVTSRIALQISGEHIFPVPPLPLLSSDNTPTTAVISRLPSTELFEARARAVDPSFEVTDENATVIADICRRLDGIPLAIELAAARTRLFSPGALLSRLEHQLDILTSAPRDGPSRHQTLRRAIAWSYELLTAEEQAFFRALSIFVGGCSMEAAQAVLSASRGREIDGLTGVSILLDHNLLRREDEPVPRFYMLETIRDFGIERLREAGEYEASSLAHAAYFLDLAKQAQNDLIGPDPTRNLDLLEREHDNLRAAMGRSEKMGNLQTCLHFVASLWRFWSTRSHLSEGIEQVCKFLEHPLADEQNAARASALSALGTMCFYVGRISDSAKYLEESLHIWKLLGDAHGTATVLNHLGWVASETGDFARTLELSTQALEIHRAADERRGIAVSLNNLVWRANYCGEYEEALRCGNESLKIRQEIRDARGTAFAYVNLGWSEIIRGEYDRAYAFLEKGRPVLEEIGDQLMLAWYYMVLGMLWIEKRDDERARPILLECMLAWNRENHNTGLAWLLTLVAEIDIARSSFAEAESRLSKAEKIWSGVQNRWGLGIVQFGCGRLMLGKEERARAIFHFGESLRCSYTVGDRRTTAKSLEMAAYVMLSQGDASFAARLLGISEAMRRIWKLPVSPRNQAAYARSVEKLENVLGAEFEKIRREAGEQPFEASVRRVLERLSR